MTEERSGGVGGVPPCSAGIWLDKSKIFDGPCRLFLISLPGVKFNRRDRMLEIFLLVIGILMPLGYAKRRRSKRRFNLRKVSMTPALAVGALTTLDVISAAGTSATTGTLRVMSIDMAWSITDLGASIDDAFQFGVAHSDYSAQEIEECLEATSSMDLGNKVEQERANRLVRMIGIITQVGAASVTGGLNFNDGRPKKTKLNWLLSIGDTLNVWVRNGSGTVYTTGAILSGIGHLWVKDSA